MRKGWEMIMGCQPLGDQCKRLRSGQSRNQEKQQVSKSSKGSVVSQEAVPFKARKVPVIIAK